MGGGNGRSTTFITANSPNMPQPKVGQEPHYVEPFYEEILQPAMLQRPTRLDPLNASDFAPIVSSMYSSQDPQSQFMGYRSARFNLTKLERLMAKDPEKAMRVMRPFNPIVLTKRSCTDVLFALLFIVFLVGWALIAYIAFTHGKPERVIYPTDSDGNACGKFRPSVYDTSTKPYLLFFDLTKCISYSTVLSDCPTRKVCVEKCPTSYYSYVQLATMAPQDFRNAVDKNVVCHYSIDPLTILNFTQLQDYVKRDLCASYTVPSAALLGRCVPGKLVEASDLAAGNVTLNHFIQQFGDPNNLIPSEETLTASKGVVDKIAKADSTAFLQKLAHDLSISWRQILVLIGCGAVASFLWTIVMRALGGLMIWLSIFLLIGGLAFGTYYCFHRYDVLVKNGAINDYSFQPMLSVYLEMPRTWLVFAIILAVFLVVLFIIMVVIRSRIRLAIALISETSKSIGSMMSTLLFPIVPFILYVLVFGLWGTVTILLSSMGTENCHYVNYDNPHDPINGRQQYILGFARTHSLPLFLQLRQKATCRFVNLTKPDQIEFLQAYNLFACFWVSCFLSGLSSMTIAGAFASYYFALRKPKDVPSFPIIRSMARAIRYHSGSIALGSLILAIVKFFKVILDFVYNKLKGVENPIGKAIYTALSCLFWCLEKILQYLTKNAYIMTAIYGSNFCTASRDSFSLLMRNIVRVVVLNRVAAFLLFVGKALIVVGNGAVAFYYFSGKWVIDGVPQLTLHYVAVPIVVVAIGTYFIADLFFDVYDMGLDTIFLCFLEDLEHNDGTEAKPYYMSKKLKSLLGKN